MKIAYFATYGRQNGMDPNVAVRSQPFLHESLPLIINVVKPRSLGKMGCNSVAKMQLLPEESVFAFNRKLNSLVCPCVCSLNTISPSHFPLLRSFVPSSQLPRPPTDIAMDVYLWQFCNEARTCHPQEREKAHEHSTQRERESHSHHFDLLTSDARGGGCVSRSISSTMLISSMIY